MLRKSNTRAALNLGVIVLGGLLLVFGLLWFCESPGVGSFLLVALIGAVLISTCTMFFKEASA